MIAAIYARKSTDQQGVADDQKSTTRQVEHARAYAAKKGWLVAEEHVYVDDGISGAEFSKRPGLLHLMNALKPKASFQVLIMSEESRLGREAIETAYALKQLVTAGVRVFFYLEDRERTLDSPTDKIMLSLTTFADELEREKARQRTYDAMLRKARAGQVTGGRVFAYDNVCSACGRSIAPGKARCCKEGHTERRINEAEAHVVRTIFRLCAAGNGYTRIAKLLNEERAPAPRPQQHRPAGWAPSSVNEILHRSLYRGEIVWNRSRKRNRWGQHDQQQRPVEEWLRIDAPALRIVTEDEWRAAHDRLTSIRSRLEHLTGRAGGKSGPRRRGNESNYLLSGFGRCARCGAGVGVTSRHHGRNRAFFYACTAYHKRGTAVCNNSLAKRLEIVDEAVLDTLSNRVLRPAVIQAEVDAVLEALNPRRAARTIDAHRAELRALDQELANLAEAIAAGGQLASLLSLLKTRQQRRDELAAVIARASSGGVAVSRKVVEGKVQERLKTWRSRLLGKNVQDARQWLREVLTGPLRFTPEGQTYRVEGELAMGALLVGIVSGPLPTVVASPTGTSASCKRKFAGIAA